MKKSRNGQRFWITVVMALWAALWISVSATAAPLAAGSAMPTLSLNDQHDKPAPVGPATRWVVFTAEKPVSDMVSAVLAAEPAGVADRLRLVYVADIPRTSGSATVLRLEGGRVTQVATARQAAELRALLGMPAKPAAP